jgi:general secretion pathway protein J
MNRLHNRDDAGFTLLELLIALTLVGLLSTLVFGGVRLASRAWEKSDTRAEDAADQWSVEHVLRHAITAAYPGFASRDRHDPTLAFNGEARSLALLAPLPWALAAGVIARMRFYLTGDKPAQRLVLAWRLDLPAADAETDLPEQEVVLLDRVRALGFAYFGALEPGQAPVWQHRWAEQSTLPQLVRVHLERSDPALPVWPDLIAAPQVTVNSACRFDPLTAECRRTQ